jgi:hypothetical protein
MSTIDEPRPEEQLPGEEPREAEEPDTLPHEPDLAPPEEDDERRERL